MIGSRFLVLLCFAAVAAGCVSDRVRESAETVLTLQSGTMSDLRDRRGTGPFTRYEVPPVPMLGVVGAAARKARGSGGTPVKAVFVSESRMEVVAKERAPDHADSTAYAGAFRTAMLAVVHPVPGEPGASRVEIHAIRRGPFHKGVVAWERDMPGWIAEVLAERKQVEDQPPVPIPEAAPGTGGPRATSTAGNGP